jgi:hypothetical protein
MNKQNQINADYYSAKAEATLESLSSSSALSARSNTATPPIQPVKPTLRLL